MGRAPLCPCPFFWVSSPAACQLARSYSLTRLSSPHSLTHSCSCRVMSAPSALLGSRLSCISLRNCMQVGGRNAACNLARDWLRTRDRSSYHDLSSYLIQAANSDRCWCCFACERELPGMHNAINYGSTRFIILFPLLAIMTTHYRDQWVSRTTTLCKGGRCASSSKAFFFFSLQRHGRGSSHSVFLHGRLLSTMSLLLTLSQRLALVR